MNLVSTIIRALEHGANASNAIPSNTIYLDLDALKRLHMNKKSDSTDTFESALISTGVKSWI